ncbi:MAG: hypothetical protein K2P94_10250 [Rhodospirillaceae bacterium]|nr:hypothetical protein [Rhodospirillaceae bacterium]
MACVSQALQVSDVFQDAACDIFAAVGGGQPQVTYVDGKLRPKNDRVRDNFETSSKGKSDIVLSDYDAFVVVAVGLHAVREQFPHPFKSVVPSAIGGHLYVPPDALGARTYVSAACLRTVIRSALLKHTAFQALRDVVTHSTAPVVVAPCPVPSEALLHPSEDVFAKCHGPDGWKLWANWSRIHDEELAAILQSLPRAVQFIAQAPQTMGVRGLSNWHFAADDPWHMNAAYGSILLRQIADALESAKR